MSFTPTQKFEWMEQLAADGFITGLALRLGIILATRYVNKDTGEAWPSQTRLCHDLQVSTEGIRKATNTLVARGHLSVTPGRGQSVSSRYRPILQDNGALWKSDRAVLHPLQTPIFGGVFGYPQTPTEGGATPTVKPDEPPTDGGGNPLEATRRGTIGSRRSAKRMATLIPNDFPNAADIAREADNAQNLEVDVLGEAAMFRAHALSHDRRAVDWLAAFRMWLLKSAQFSRTQTATGRMFSGLSYAEEKLRE